MSGSDRERLEHMLAAAQEALGFISGKVNEDLNSDRMLLLALTRVVEV